VHVPFAFEPEVHWNDLSIGLQILPDACEPLVAMPDEVPLHLKLCATPSGVRSGPRPGEGRRDALDPTERCSNHVSARAQRRPLQHGQPGRSGLQPEERRGIGDRTSRAPTGFVLLGVFFEVRGAHRAAATSRSRTSSLNRPRVVSQDAVVRPSAEGGGTARCSARSSVGTMEAGVPSNS